MNIWKSIKHEICALLLVFMAMHGASASPVVSIATSNNLAAVGENITVAVSISDVVDLYGYQFSLLFDPTILYATTATKGTFLEGGGSTFFDAGTIDNANGSISFVFESLQGGVFGVTGSGSLATFSFTVVGSGTSILRLGDVQFLDSTFTDVGAQAMTLAVAAVPEPSTFWLLAAGLTVIAAVRRRTAG